MKVRTNEIALISEMGELLAEVVEGVRKSNQVRCCGERVCEGSQRQQKDCQLPLTSLSAFIHADSCNSEYISTR